MTQYPIAASPTNNTVTLNTVNLTLSTVITITFKQTWKANVDNVAYNLKH